MFSNIAFHPLNYPICSHSHFYFSSLIDSVSNPRQLPVTIMREVLRCRITGWAVALPGSLSSLKVGFWKGRLMVPSCCGAWGVPCSLPGTAPLECGGGFVCIPIYESGEAGDKKQELNASTFQSMFPFTWVRGRQRKSFASQLDFWFPGQCQGHLSVWSPWIIAALGAFVPKSPSGVRSRRILWKERSQATETFSLNAIKFLPFWFFSISSNYFFSKLALLLVMMYPTGGKKGKTFTVYLGIFVELIKGIIKYFTQGPIYCYDLFNMAV